MKKNSFFSKGYFLGLIVGFGAGISIGVAFSNIIIGFFIAAIFGICFGIVFENTNMTGDKELARNQKNILFLLVGLTGLLLISTLTYYLYLK